MVVVFVAREWLASSSSRRRAQGQPTAVQPSRRERKFVPSNKYDTDAQGLRGVRAVALLLPGALAGVAERLTHQAETL